MHMTKLKFTTKMMAATLALSFGATSGLAQSAQQSTTAPSTTAQPQAPATPDNNGQANDPRFGDQLPNAPQAQQSQTTQDNAQPANDQTATQQQQSATDQSATDATSLKSGQDEQAAQDSAQQKRSNEEPLGAATAEKGKTRGGVASRPAGVAIAPAKQHRTRSILIKTGAILAGAAALGTVYALHRASPSVPPGATTTAGASH